MKELLDEINKLKLDVGISKHEILTEGILSSIQKKHLKKGDRLPSVNNMVKEVGFARKTIVKAYDDLKARGIVESKNMIGYFVVNENIDQKLKVAIILYSFHTFQEAFYDIIRSQLDENIQMDIFFHHNNIDIFETILENIKNKYGKFVIAPIQHPRSSQILNQFDSYKLIIIDRKLSLDNEHASVHQLFAEPTYEILTELLPKIRKYEKLILLYRENSDQPHGIKEAFERFVNQHQIQAEIRSKYQAGSVANGHAYIVINDNELWQLLKDSVENDLKIGSEVGILSHNDSTVKQIIFGGISTFSTDFEQMGIQTAELLKSQANSNICIPTKLLDRNSI